MFQVLNTMEPTTTNMKWQFQNERKLTTIKTFIDTFDYGTVAFIETKKSAGNVSEVLKEMKDFNFFQDSNYRKRSKKSKIKNELFPEHAKLKLVSNMFICQTENCLADIHVGEERFVFSEQKKIKACPIVKNRMHDSECSSFTSDPLISREDEQMSSYEPGTNLQEKTPEFLSNMKEMFLKIEVVMTLISNGGKTISLQNLKLQVERSSGKNAHKGVHKVKKKLNIG